MSDAEEITDLEEGGENENELTTTEDENLGDRLQSSCAGICIGILLFLGAFPLLYWNESRAVERYEALNEAEGQVTTVFDPWNIDADNEGRLVHFSVNITNGGGTSTTNNTNNAGPTDPIFGINSPTALKLHRQTQMYQWIEDKKTRTTKTAGGGKKTTTTYSYNKQWTDSLVDSSYFQKSGYRNPTSMEFTSEVFTAERIKIGAFDLPMELIYRVSWEEGLDVTVENITAGEEELRGRAVGYDGGYYFTSLVNYENSSNPQIGDQKVFFQETPPSIITIVGVQNGQTLGAFVSETGEGGDVLLFQRGNLTSVAMFDAAEQENKIATWFIRLAGFGIMTLGLYLVFRPVEVFADIIPCCGSIIGYGLIFMAVLISSVLSLVTISIAWLVARPEIGAIVLCVSLVVVGLCAFGVKKYGKGKNDDEEEDVVNDFEGVGGKVTGVPPNPAATVMAVNEPPTVYALPEGQVAASAPQQQPYGYGYVGSAPQQQPYGYIGSAPQQQQQQQQPIVTVSAQPYVPKY